ncbi:hypothetical protein [Methanoplanus limicola]|nr:hypothetical protein [Methanoplanus limicola]
MIIPVATSPKNYIYIYNQIPIMTTTANRADHSPRLDTILMVEEFIKENSGEYKKTELWNNLPKKMMYQTFMKIIDYLISSNKIGADAEGYIIWIYNPELYKKYAAREDLRIR